MFNFLRTYKPFSKMPVASYAPTSRIWEFTCSTLLPKFVGDVLFNSSYSGEGVVVIVVLICVFLTTGDVEHSFICILAMCIFYSEDCVKYFGCFVVGLFVLLNFKSSLYIVDLGLVSDICTMDIFSWCSACLLIFMQYLLMSGFQFL